MGFLTENIEVLRASLKRGDKEDQVVCIYHLLVQKKAQRLEAAQSRKPKTSETEVSRIRSHSMGVGGRPRRIKKEEKPKEEHAPKKSPEKKKRVSPRATPKRAFSASDNPPPQRATNRIEPPQEHQSISPPSRRESKSKKKIVVSSAESKRNPWSPENSGDDSQSNPNTPRDMTQSPVTLKSTNEVPQNVSSLSQSTKSPRDHFRSSWDSFESAFRLPSPKRRTQPKLKSVEPSHSKDKQKGEQWFQYGNDNPKKPPSPVSSERHIHERERKVAPGKKDRPILNLDAISNGKIAKPSPKFGSRSFERYSPISRSPLPEKFFAPPMEEEPDLQFPISDR